MQPALSLVTCHAGVLHSSISHASLGSHRRKCLCHLWLLMLLLPHCTLWVWIFLPFQCVGLNCFVDVFPQRAVLGNVLGVINTFAGWFAACIEGAKWIVVSVQAVLDSQELLRKRLLCEMKVRWCSAVAFFSLWCWFETSIRGSRGDTKGCQGWEAASADSVVTRVRVQ